MAQYNRVHSQLTSSIHKQFNYKKKLCRTGEREMAQLLGVPAALL